ncbi:MAG: chemotaxis protein CheA [Rhodobacteraceae bacterium]|nr:chemotaxis protein CheA [Paracoccaceae bacterium]
MDDLEEFLGVFFQECEERVGELQDCLATILEGEWDPETLNAAFRAVHSVKGGAGAFGLDGLVEFTHIFETVMDQIRSNVLEPTASVMQVLLRASDMMVALIEEAQGNGEASKEIKLKIMNELAVMAGMEPPAPEADGADSPAAETEETAEASDEGDAEGADDAEDADTDDASDEADDAEEDDEDEDSREVLITIAPGPEFIRSGHDPLRLLRAIQNLGATTLEVDGGFPPLDNFDPMVVSLEWRVRLRTSTPTEELEDFFIMYRLSADIEIDEIDEDSPADDRPQAEETVVEAAEPVEEKATIVAEAPKESPSKPEPKPEPVVKSAPEPAKVEAAPAAGAAKSDEGGKKAAPTAKMNKALRVELSRIDRLVNMVGEIVITQAVLAQNMSELDTSSNIELSHAIEALSRQTRELQESVMAIRAQPVKSVFSRMPRVVRDLTQSLSKECRLELSGEHVEVDTTVIEELSEPLTHMLRNSMDHGVEDPDKREAAGKPRCGTIHLGAEHRGERVRIVIEDDGAGINRERVLEKAIENGIVPAEATLSDEEIDMLIFHPGFSTAAEITAVSGRGVGMDVVKKKVQALGGRVSVISNPGKGTQFNITLPLTLAVLDGMTIGVGEERFILPLGSVVEAVKIDDQMVDHLPGDVRVLRYRGEWLPLISLVDVLHLDHVSCSQELVVVIETETDGRVALLVSELLGQRQVVLKSLETNFRRVEGVSGATILGDGRVALILDIPSLTALSHGGGHSSVGMEMF